jgi:hypothetical protein
MANTATNLVPLNDSVDLDQILRMAQEGGPDILTPDEMDVYQQHLQSNRGDPTDHYANLAEFMDDRDIGRLAQDVVDWVTMDDKSRAEWQLREARGIRMLGLSEKTEGGANFAGASRVVHPLLAEACVQFQARAIAELWPATGPVKTRILGKPTEDRMQQAERVQDFLNYQYCELIDGAFEEEDRLLMRLPISGSCFKKVFFDPIEETNVSRFIEPADFIVPFSASSLRTATRYTHRYFQSGFEVESLIESGFYRDVPLIETPNEMVDYPAVRREIDEAEGRQRVLVDQDERYTILETCCYLNLPSLPDQAPVSKRWRRRTAGIGLPYIVHIEKESRQVLAVRRNWKIDDPKRRKRVQVVHKYFLPGLGFYGMGFVHFLGGLSDAATGSLRAFLDAANFANMQGGYRSRDAKLPGGDQPIGPGEWREVDSTAEELSKAFFHIPYKEPSPALFQVLGLLTEFGQRFATTTEAMVGEANNNGPVGTTLALIEQGAKLFSAIHKRLHNANGVEFKILAELNYEFMPEQYPYELEGKEQMALRQDFDGRVDVIPVSDPNIVSNVQRIAQAQAVLQLATESPDLYNRKAVHKNLLTALRVADIDSLMPDKDEIPRREPVEEDMCILYGQPIQVMPDQDHAAHMSVHQAFFAGLPPEYQKQFQGVWFAHMAQHMAWQHRIGIEQAMGMPLPPPTSILAEGSEDENKLEQEELPPEIERQISEQTAIIVQLMQQQAAQANPNAQAQAAETQLAQEQMQREQERKDAETHARIARDDAKVRADMIRNDALANANIQAKAQTLAGKVKAESDRIQKGKEYE